jgi:Pentapeptide repeats (8 copies)
MANKKQLALLTKGHEAWNQWRKLHPTTYPLLSGADLSGADLSGADLSGADLSKAILSRANLSNANLSNANLSNANLKGAKLNETNLSGADLSEANLSEAELNGADLSKATLVGTNLINATLNNCRVYGISTWDVKLEGSRQMSLIITPSDQAEITADNLDIAQFIYLMLNNQKIPPVIDSINSKIVLILGRFTYKRREISDAIKGKLRENNYLPILFDFDRTSSRSLSETLSTLAHLSRFIIVDLTDPMSIPQELAVIVPQVRIPVQPLIAQSEKLYSMFNDLFLSYPWVLEPYTYKDLSSLLTAFQKKVIEPSERKARELGLK